MARERGAAITRAGCVKHHRLAATGTVTAPVDLSGSASLTVFPVPELSAASLPLRALVVWAGGQFRRAATPIPPIGPSTTLVVRDIYSDSRNPMYLGMSLMMVGMAILTGCF
jgi:protein-S-isoprenylcysteine O-methyltransferase Ste14